MTKDIRQQIMLLMQETASCSVAQGQRNLKRANELLADNDMTWAMLLNVPGSVAKTRTFNKVSVIKQEIDLAEVDNMFEALNEVALPESTQEFIADLYHAYEVYNTVTPKQYEALKRNYDRFCN